MSHHTEKEPQGFNAVLILGETLCSVSFCLSQQKLSYVTLCSVTAQPALESIIQLAIFLWRVEMPPLQQTFPWAAVLGGCGGWVDLWLALQCYSRQSAVFSWTLPKHVLPLEGIIIVSVIIHPTNLLNEKQDCIIYSVSVRKRRAEKGTKTRGKKAREW